MCLAIYKPKGAVIKEQNLEAGFYSNCSGSGFMYRDKGEMKVIKGLMSFKEFYAALQQVGQADYDMGIHFRAATHGPINQANCHPFSMCDGKFAMIHNGIFRVPIKRGDLSDTGNFCIQVLEPAIKDGSYKQHREMHEHPLWGWGAVVLMSGAGEVVIYNQEMGHWNEGVWYSNSAYQVSAYRSLDNYIKKATEAEYRPIERKARNIVLHSCEGECDW